MIIRGGLEAGLQERPLVALHVVGRDLERVNTLRLHVPHEVHQIAAVPLHRVVRQNTSQIQGTRAWVELGADPPARRERLSNYPKTGCNPRKIQDLRALSDSYLARKTSTLAAAGLSPSRKSLRSGTSGTRGGAGSASAGRTASRLMRGGMESIRVLLPDEIRKHEADYVLYHTPARNARDAGPSPGPFHSRIGVDTSSTDFSGWHM